MKTSAASVLIVDDSTAMRSIVRDMLMRLGFRDLDEAEDARAALSRIRNRAFSLIISDLHMDDAMSGIDLLREVRRLSTPGSNRFILATSERSWGFQTTAKLDGADAYIVKPFTIGTLRSKVELVLGRS